METLRVRARAVAQEYMDKFPNDPNSETKHQVGKFLANLAFQVPVEKLDRIKQAKIDLYKQAIDQNLPISDWNAFATEVLKRAGVKLPGPSMTTTA